MTGQYGWGDCQTDGVDRMDIPVPEDLAGLVTELFGHRLPLVRDYVRLLANEGIEWGLIGPRETDRLWERHIVNSLCVSPLIAKGLFVADCGSGAGLPGIVLAIARPDLYVDLVEPMARRCDFLNLVVSRLDLSSTVNVIRARVEDYQPIPDVVTCRALANLSTLIPMTSALIPPATLLAIKGDRATIEIENAQELLDDYQLQAEILQPSASTSSTSEVSMALPSAPSVSAELPLGTIIKVTSVK